MRDTCVATFTQSCVIEPHGENTIWTNKDTHNKIQGSYTDYTIDTDHDDYITKHGESKSQNLDTTKGEEKIQ